MRKRVTIAISILILLAAAAATIAQSQLPMIGASALLYPSRRPSMRPAPEHCVERTFDGVGVRLSGWVCTADAVTKQADHRLSSRHCRQSRQQRQRHRSVPASRFQRHRLRQPAPRPLGRRSMHIRLLRETGSEARPRSGRRRARDPDRPFARRRGGVAGGRHRPTHHGGRRGLDVLRLADHRHRTRARSCSRVTHRRRFHSRGTRCGIHRRPGQPVARGSGDHGSCVHDPRRPRSRDATRAFEARLRSAPRTQTVAARRDAGHNDAFAMTSGRRSSAGSTRAAQAARITGVGATVSTLSIA